MRSKDQENSAHRVPCLIELFACLRMLVFRLPLRKIIEIKAYFTQFDTKSLYEQDVIEERCS